MVKLDGVELENRGEEMTEDRSDEYRKLRACVEKLDGVNKSIVLLYLEDQSYREIGEVTGLSENHIAVKIKRIKGRLLKCIKQ